MEIIFATLENVAHEADGQNEHYAPEQNVPEQFRIAIRTMVVSVMPATDRIYSFETGVVRLHVVLPAKLLSICPRQTARNPLRPSNGHALSP
jgi:hypothetical protein